MSHAVELIPLDRDQAKRFLQSAHPIYKDDPHWVAPLAADLQTLLSEKNPFFHHAEMQLWVALRNGLPVGRIAAVLDHRFNDYQNVSAALFGYFETIDDAEVGRALLEKVQEWARAKGLKTVLGPIQLSTNNECGLLIEGFDSAPKLMMTYNPPHYAKRIEEAGFTKAKDLLAYIIELNPDPEERLDRIRHALKARGNSISVRPLLRRELNRDLPKLKEIYNAAWQENWGFVPMTVEEIDFLAERLEPLLWEGLSWIAEHDGEPAGFLLALPDYNEFLQPLKGRLLHPGLLRLLAARFRLSHPKNVRLVAFGIKKKFRRRGVEALLFGQTLKECLARKFSALEASWILEDNRGVQALIEMFGGAVYKRYRIYERKLRR